MMPRKKESNYQAFYVMVNAIFSAWLCWYEGLGKTRLMGSSAGGTAWGAVLVGVAAPRELGHGGMQSRALLWQCHAEVDCVTVA